MNSYDYIPDWWISGSTQILEFSKRLVVRRWLMNGTKMCKG